MSYNSNLTLGIVGICGARAEIFGKEIPLCWALQKGEALKLIKETN